MPGSRDALMLSLFGDIAGSAELTALNPTAIPKLLSAVLTVGSTLQLDETLQQIVDVARHVLEADYGALGVKSPDGRLSRFIHSGLNQGQVAKIGHLPEGHGLLGLVVQEPCPVRTDRIASHPSSAGFPTNHPPMDTFLGVPIFVRGEVFGSIYLADSSERTAFDDRDEAVLQILANAASIAIDNARLFEESQTREAWLKAVAAVNARLLSGGSRDETLAELVRTTRRLTDGNLVCIVRYDLGEGPGVHVAESRTRGTTVSDGTVLDLSGTVIDEAARSRRTISAPSASTVPALHVSSEESVVALPLSGTSFGGGVLFASRRSDRPWGVDEIEQLTAMADIAAVTVEFAEQQRKERLVDVLEDRDRIARDLHDHVIQQLFATGLSLQGALQRPGDEETIRTVLDNSVDQLDRTVREIRTAVFDLHTSEMSTPTSLRRRLLDAVNGLSGHSSITPSVTFEGTIDSSVPARLAPHAEAVVREGLSNALRHAHANAIDVTIRATEDLVISIVDDGVGIDQATRIHGLDNLATRARQCGGSSNITSENGVTELVWRVPLSPRRSPLSIQHG